MNESKFLDEALHIADVIQNIVDKKISAIPGYGPVISVFLTCLVDSVGSFVEGHFKEVYSDRVRLLHQPVIGATLVRLRRFYEHYPTLKATFQEELNAFDEYSIARLRKFYPLLYKLWVTKDLLLTTAYAEELSTNDLESIFQDYFRRDDKPTKVDLLVSSVTTVINKDVESFVSIEDLFIDLGNNLLEEAKDSDELKAVLKKVISEKVLDLIPEKWIHALKKNDDT